MALLRLSAILFVSLCAQQATAFAQQSIPLPNQPNGEPPLSTTLPQPNGEPPLSATLPFSDKPVEGTLGLGCHL
jgi:hypothetical protein